MRFKWSEKQRAFTKVCCCCRREYNGGTNSEAAPEVLRQFFGLDPRCRTDGLQTGCKECNNARSAKGGGRPIADIDAMLAEQGGKCALCPTPIERGMRCHVDHDHATGFNRGLLCPRCNQRMAGVDDDEWLSKAVAYRDHHRTLAKTMPNPRNPVMVRCAHPYCNEQFKQNGSRLYCSAECMNANQTNKDRARRHARLRDMRRRFYGHPEAHPRKPPPQVEDPSAA